MAFGFALMALVSMIGSVSGCHVNPAVTLGLVLTRRMTPIAGVAIGASLAAIHLVGIPLTGVSVNPARALGPALFADNNALSQVWLFILAPLCGAVVAVVIHWVIHGEPEMPMAAPAAVRPDPLASRATP